MYKIIPNNYNLMSVFSGTTHSVRLEEQLAFSDWINTNLGHDPDLKHLLPIDAEGKGLYDSVKDGILLWYVYAVVYFQSTLNQTSFSVQYLSIPLIMYMSLTLSKESYFMRKCNINCCYFGCLRIGLLHA